jgi:hypothetical protein
MRSTDASSGGTSRRGLRKKSCAVNHGGDLYSFLSYPIDDPVAHVQKLSKVLFSVLRNHSAGEWETGHLFDARDDALDEKTGIVGRVAGNELCDDFEIRER